MRKPRLYVAVYHSRHQPPPAHPSETAAALYAALGSGEFPYDGGDDPSFFSARHHDGSVTWGVCRADVRGAIRKGDWVVFISLQEDEDAGLTRYRFVAALCVERKLAHTSLFDGPFAGYLNLLIRPSGEGWEHHEPSLRKGHVDWLWRICRGRGLGKRKPDVKAEGKRHRPGQPLPFPAASNYVVFSKSSALIARRPPLVATYREGEVKWEDDPAAQAIRAAVLADSGRDLRIDNTWRPHRHVRRTLDDPTWPSALREALALTDWQANEFVTRLAPSSTKRPRSRHARC